MNGEKILKVIGIAMLVLAVLLVAISQAYIPNGDFPGDAESMQNLFFYAAMVALLGLLFFAARYLLLHFSESNLMLNDMSSCEADDDEESDDMTADQKIARDISLKTWTLVRILGSFDDDDNWYGYLCIVDESGNPKKILFSGSHNYADHLFCIRDGQKVSFRYTEEDQDPDDYDYMPSCFLIPFVSKESESSDVDIAAVNSNTTAENDFSSL